MANERKQTGLSASAVEVLKRIDAYFGEAQHEVRMYEAGDMLSIEITYTDFKPKREVRRAIEDISPRIDIEVLTRHFSSEAYADIILEVLAPEEIYVKTDGCTLTSVRLLDFIDGKLMGYDMTATTQED